MKNIHIACFITAFLLAASAPAIAQAWKTYTPPFDDTIGIASLDVVDENTVWAMGARYGSNDTFYFNLPSATWVARTVNGGASWSVSQVPMGEIPFASSLTAVDGNTAYVTGLEFDPNTFAPQNAKTFRTTDGGQTWSLLPVGWDVAASWPNYVRDVSPTRTLIFGDPRDGEFEIYATDNGGNTWSRIPGAVLPDPQMNEYGSVGAGDGIGQHLWFGTGTGRVFRSTDGGASWEVGQTQLPYILGLNFSDTLHGVAVAQLDAVTQLINHTSDGGRTWAEIIPMGINRTLGIEYIPNSAYILIGGTNGGAQSGPLATWVSPDRGKSWQQISAGELIGWPCFLNGKTGWAGEYQQFDHPTRLYQYTGSPLTGLISPAVLDAQVSLSPNPTRDLVQVEVCAHEAADFWVLLNDAQGRLLRKIEVSRTVVFSEKIDLSGLPAGAYTVTVANEKGSKAQQIVKE